MDFIYGEQIHIKLRMYINQIYHTRYNNIFEQLRPNRGNLVVAGLELATFCGL